MKIKLTKNNDHDGLSHGIKCSLEGDLLIIVIVGDNKLINSVIFDRSSENMSSENWPHSVKNLHSVSFSVCPQCVCYHFDEPASDMEYIEVLTEGLERVLMVRGGGREVITIYS